MQLLCSFPVLSHYDLAPFLVVSVDASEMGRGAVLAHLYPDGRERPVAYASRTLSPAERNYAVIDKETLAAVWAVTVMYYQYVAGREFVLYTDHDPRSAC